MVVTEIVDLKTKTETSLEAIVLNELLRQEVTDQNVVLVLQDNKRKQVRLVHRAHKVIDHSAAIAIKNLGNQVVNLDRRKHRMVIKKEIRSRHIRDLSQIAEAADREARNRDQNQLVKKFLDF